MTFCKIGDIDIHYEVSGEGYPLLFIGGLSSSTLNWEGQVPFFSEHYRCIVFDNRGSGLSGKPVGPYTMKTLAEDALRLLDSLHIPKTLVFSLSMGGMIALELASIAPSRIRAMLLGCTNAGGRDRVPASPEVVSLLVNNAGLTREQITAKTTTLLFSRKFRTENPKVIEEHYLQQISVPAQPWYAFQAQLAAIDRFDRTADLKEIKIPALVVTGTEDVLVPPANSNYLASKLPNSELLRIPGAGHALHVECRDFLNRAAHDFYRKHLT